MLVDVMFSEAMEIRWCVHTLVIKNNDTFKKHFHKDHKEIIYFVLIIATIAITKDTSVGEMLASLKEYSLSIRDAV